MRFEFGACESAVVQFSSLLLIMKDGVDRERKSEQLPFANCLISQLQTQLGAYYSSFLKETSNGIHSFPAYLGLLLI